MQAAPGERRIVSPGSLVSFGKRRFMGAPVATFPFYRPEDLWQRFTRDCIPAPALHRAHRL